MLWIHYGVNFHNIVCVYMCLLSAIHLVKQIDHSPSICGMASLNSCIYVLGRHFVKAYEDQNPFNLQKTIQTTPRIPDPWDIVSSELLNCLYVTDQGSQCIWKILPEDSQLTVWLNHLENLSTISVSSNGCVLLIKDTRKSTQLELYGSDAKLFRAYTLQNEIKCPIHAIQKPGGEFIVAHRWRDVSGPWTISQLDQDGKMINYFKPVDTEPELNFPCYFSADPRAFRLFVADIENNQVIMFNSNTLRCCKVLLTEENDEIYHPWRICFNVKEGQLIVGQLNGFVNIYDAN